jgi:hypothetical protein
MSHRTRRRSLWLALELDSTLTGYDMSAYRSVIGVLTTMHAKERVIEPVLRKAWGLELHVARDVNTDAFGTFSREIARAGSQLDAARAKIEAGFQAVPSARVGLASEGSFGPHPYVPFAAVGRELVLMIDRDSGLELAGYDVSLEANFGHVVAASVEEAIEFGNRIGFPSHGLIVIGCEGGQPAPHQFIKKDAGDKTELEGAVGEAIAIGGAAFIETDMRAHRNPTRMAAIERATLDLVRRYNSRCPICGHPGFDITERRRGLPCAWCGTPTFVIKTEVLCCQACGHRLERCATPSPAADPGQCEVCNP